MAGMERNRCPMCEEPLILYAATGEGLANTRCWYCRQVVPLQFIEGLPPETEVTVVEGTEPLRED